MMGKQRADAGILKYSDKEIIERNSVPEPNSGCWLLWMGSLNEWGYGRLGHNRSERQAHRLAYAAFVGPITANLHVRHGCDVRVCVNPAHLSLGDRVANMQDAVRRGRMNPRCGEDNATSKLTHAAVDEIRSSPISDAMFAAKFGVHRSTIQAVREGKTWASR